MSVKEVGRDLVKMSCELVRGVDGQQTNETISDLIANKVTIDFDMFRAFVKCWIGCNVKSGLIVAKEKMWRGGTETKISRVIELVRVVH